MKLGSIAGIEVRVHYSALFVFGLVIAVIAYGYLPAVTPNSSTSERIAVAAIVAVLLAVSLIAHEFGHAFIARRRGKKVEAVSLYLFGGAAHIGGDAMTAADEIATGLAGPAVSALLPVAFGAAGIAAINKHPQAGILLLDVALANAALAAFNLLPGFPMDGGRVLRGILWRRSGNVIAATKRAALSGRLIAYAIVAGGCILAVRGSIFFGLWAVAIGWFLLGLAQQYYRATVLRAALEGLKARDLGAQNLPTLQTSDTVAAAAEHFGLGARSRSLIVLFGDRPAGIATDVEVARVDADEASTKTVGAIMTRIADVPALDPEDEATALLEVMQFSPTGSVLIAAEDGAFEGIVRREDIVRYVEMVEELGNSSAVSAKNLRELQLRRSIPMRSNAARG
jgi:Zn-dependent protease/CBS domain-containing protein